MTTPEEIEGIPKDAYPELQTLGRSLHDSTAGVLDTPLSAKEYEREEQLRRTLNLKYSESISHLSSRIADLEALQRDMRLLKGWTSNDAKRLESRKIERYVADKEIRIQGPHVPFQQ